MAAARWWEGQGAPATASRRARGQGESQGEMRAKRGEEEYEDRDDKWDLLPDIWAPLQ